MVLRSTEFADTVPSTSVSLLVTVTETGVSSLVTVASLVATGAVGILIPKLTLVILLLEANVTPATRPSIVPSFPVVELVMLFLISPLFEHPAGNEGVGVIPEV